MPALDAALLVAELVVSDELLEVFTLLLVEEEVFTLLEVEEATLVELDERLVVVRLLDTLVATLVATLLD